MKCFDQNRLIFILIFYAIFHIFPFEFIQILLFHSFLFSTIFSNQKNDKVQNFNFFHSSPEIVPLTEFKFKRYRISGTTDNSCNFHLLESGEDISARFSTFPSQISTSCK